MHAVKLGLRHIASQVQQFPDALCRVRPGDQHSRTALCAVAGGQADALGAVPNGVLSIVQVEACAIGAIVTHEKAGVILQRLVFHQVSTDDQTAVAVIGSDAQRLVDDLLGIPNAIGYRRGGRNRLRRGKGVGIKKGHLLAVLGFQPFDVPVDMIFTALDNLRGQLRHKLPGKDALAGAGEIPALPHQQTGIVQRSVTDAGAAAAHKKLRIAVLVGRFQVLRALGHVGMGGKVHFDLLLFIDQIVLRVGEDGVDQPFIQKRRKLRRRKVRTARNGIRFGFHFSLRSLAPPFPKKLTLFGDPSSCVFIT